MQELPYNIIFQIALSLNNKLHNKNNKILFLSYIFEMLTLDIKVNIIII
jgi:hypothetical protein